MSEAGSSGPSVNRYRIKLTPLVASDIEELIDRLKSPTTWVVAVRGLSTDAQLRSYFQGFLRESEQGLSFPVVARIAETGEIAAFSRFQRHGDDGARVEVGYTWVADRWQRSYVNTELKFLMLERAFDEWRARRVEFWVDPQNDRSQAAMRRIGATLEGTLRKFRAPSAHDRGDRMLFSILDAEWPLVRAQLLERLKWKRPLGHSFQVARRSS